eukprot:1160925-Pelagomonas_calceolata.AAC.8
MRSECPGGHLLRAGGGLFGGAFQSQLRGVLTIGSGFLLMNNELSGASSGGARKPVPEAQHS